MDEAQRPDDLDELADVVREMLPELLTVERKGSMVFVYFLRPSVPRTTVMHLGRWEAVCPGLMPWIFEQRPSPEEVVLAVSRSIAYLGTQANQEGDHKTSAEFAALAGEIAGIVNGPS